MVRNAMSKGTYGEKYNVMKHIWRGLQYNEAYMERSTME